MKNFFIIILTITCLFLISCTGKEVENIKSNDKIENQEDINDDENSYGVKELNICFSGFSDYNSLMEEVLVKVSQETGVDITFEYIESIGSERDNYMNVILSMINAGKKVDAFGIDYEMDSKEIKTMIDKKTLYNFNDIFSEYAPNYYYNILKEDVGNANYNGKIMFIPNNVVWDTRPCVVVNNKYLKYVDESINTIEDYSEFMYEILKNEPDVAPSIYPDTYILMYACIYGNGYYQIPELGSYNVICGKREDEKINICRFDQMDIFKNFITMYKGWIENNFFNRENKKDTASRILLMYDIAFVYGDNYFESEYTVFPLYIEKPWQKYLTGRSGLCCINDEDKAKSLLQFIEWINQSQESYNLLVFGIENKHYKKNDAKKILPLKIEDEVFYNEIRSRYYQNWEYDLINAYLPDGYANSKRKSTENMQYSPFEKIFIDNNIVIPDMPTSVFKAKYKSSNKLHIDVFEKINSDSDIDIILEDYYTKTNDYYGILIEYYNNLLEEINK